MPAGLFGHIPGVVGIFMIVLVVHQDGLFTVVLKKHCRAMLSSYTGRTWVLGTLPVFTGRVHVLWSRPINTGIVYDAHKPVIRARDHGGSPHQDTFTGSVYRRYVM